MHVEQRNITISIQFKVMIVECHLIIHFKVKGQLLTMMQ